MDVRKQWRKRKMRTYLTTGRKLRKRSTTTLCVQQRIFDKTTQVTPRKHSSAATETFKK